jgi:xylose isomerase
MRVYRNGTSTPDTADNPGNGDNTNYGAHCMQTWLPEASSSYDVISFQFGLHDIAYDEERLTLSQYKMLLANITQHLVTLQRARGTKLVWVKTTPVPTVASAYGFGCDGSATVCLNPARFDTDVVKYNAAAEEVVAAAIAQQVSNFIAHSNILNGTKSV